MAVPTVHIFTTVDYDDDVRRARELIAGGGLVVLPTETVYGAAGLLTNPSARRRLADLRANPAGGPFTIHLAHRDQARQYLGDVGEMGERLMKKLWPGPVGLVFEVPEQRRREVAAGLNLPESDIYDGSTITLRCPDHVVATDVLAGVQGPAVMTVAGKAAAAAGAASPENWSSDAMAAELEGKVDLLIDAGPTPYAKPSTILRVHGDRYEIVREGVYDARIIERQLRTTILFVCSGNTCRSPMAEAIARRLLARRLEVPEAELEKKGVSVVSAGCMAMPGSRATPQAVEAVKGLGGDLSHHRSRPISVELIHQADVIYTMGRGHAAAVASLVPSAREKITTLDPSGDIDDPIGGDTALYQDLAGQLQVLIEKRLEELAADK